MKNLLIVFLFAFIQIPPLLAQWTPEFEFDLYFENNLGYTDRVTIGYDPRAVDYDIEPQFNEINIDTTLIQGEFEVRLLDTWGGQWQSKKQIMEKYRATNNSFTDSSWAVILGVYTVQIYSNNAPEVKISWDSTLFDNPILHDAHDNTVLIDWYYSYVGFPQPAYSGVYYEHFLKDRQELSIDLENSTFQQFSRETQLHQYDTTSVFNIVIANYTLWELDSLQNPVSISEADESRLSLYPTVASDNIYIDTEAAITHYALIDRLGSYKRHFVEPVQSNSTQEVDVSYLPPGSYSFIFFLDSGEFNVRRFIKH